jgi:hypothetical protein
VGSHAPAGSGDTRCLVVEHPAELVDVFDDDRHDVETAYFACLRFTAARPPRVLNKRVHGIPAAPSPSGCPRNRPTHT